MAQYPVPPTSTRPQHTTPTIKLVAAAPHTLDPQHRVLFAQRLALLIKRMRAATQEDNADER
jgi:hypothetical protein